MVHYKEKRSSSSLAFNVGVKRMMLDSIYNCLIKDRRTIDMAYAPA